jgi:hypothetical protein
MRTTHQFVEISSPGEGEELPDPVRRLALPAHLPPAAPPFHTPPPPSPFHLSLGSVYRKGRCSKLYTASFPYSASFLPPGMCSFLPPAFPILLTSSLLACAPSFLLLSLFCSRHLPRICSRLPPFLLFCFHLLLPFLLPNSLLT